MQKYHSSETLSEIQEKGFSVYNYISVSELLNTVRKDYLDILSVLHVPLWVWVIGFAIFWYTLGNSILPLLLFFIVIYFCIFIFLFFKLLKRTYFFLLISNVVFSRDALLLGNKIHKNPEEKELTQNLEKYEKIFLEYLWWRSRLEEYVVYKKKTLFREIITDNKIIKLGKDAIENADRSEGAWRFILPAILAYGLYIVSMYVSYYIGYFLWFIFIKVYSLILRWYLRFRSNTALKIKRRVEIIDSTLKKMQHIYTLISKKYTEFSHWEIADISQFTSRNFESFYSEIYSIFEHKKKLKALTESEMYNGFIDFPVFEWYLRKEFNKPVASMLKLLEKNLKLLRTALTKLKNTEASDMALAGTIETKKRIIENNILVLESNLSKLKKSQL